MCWWSLLGSERMSCGHAVLPVVSGEVCTTALQAGVGDTWWSDCSSDVPSGPLPAVRTVSIDVIPAVRVAAGGELESCSGAAP